MPPSPSVRNENRCLTSLEPSLLSQLIKFTLEASQRGSRRAQFVHTPAAWCFSSTLSDAKLLLMLQPVRCHRTSAGILFFFSPLRVMEYERRCNDAALYYMNQTDGCSYLSDCCRSPELVSAASPAPLPSGGC